MKRTETAAQSKEKIESPAATKPGLKSEKKGRPIGFKLKTHLKAGMARA